MSMIYLWRRQFASQLGLRSWRQRRVVFQQWLRLVDAGPKLSRRQRALWCYAVAAALSKGLNEIEKERSQKATLEALQRNGMVAANRPEDAPASGSLVSNVGRKFTSKDAKRLKEMAERLANELDAFDLGFGFLSFELGELSMRLDRAHAILSQAGRREDPTSRLVAELLHLFWRASGKLPSRAERGKGVAFLRSCFELRNVQLQTMGARELSTTDGSLSGHIRRFELPDFVPRSWRNFDL